MRNFIIASCDGRFFCHILLQQQRQKQAEWVVLKRVDFVSVSNAHLAITD
jgi:hypothetical protein